MDFKNKQQQNIKQQLLKYDLPEYLIDKIVLHEDDNWVEQLIIKLDNAQTPTEALSKTLELFMLRNFSRPQYLNKQQIFKRFPISQRKIEDMIRAKLIPIASEINQKNRIFDIDAVYDHFENYKVDSIVNRVNPLALRNALAIL